MNTTRLTWGLGRDEADSGHRVWLYPLWKDHLAARLREGSELVPTAHGVVECNRGHGRAPVVVGIHGAPGGYDQIPATFPNFPGTGFRLLTWSRPGYLRTPLACGHSFEEQADLLAALLDTLGLERVAVFAFSGGGPVAVQFAARYPERLWALILESAITRHRLWPEVWPLESVLGNWLYSLAAHIRPRQALTGLLSLESQLDEVTARDRLERAVRDERRAGVLRGLLQSASPAALRHAGLVNDAEHILRLEPLPFDAVRAPTLILHGERDAQAPLEYAERAARLIPGSELVRIPEGLHLLSLAEDADAIAARRLEFLMRHRPVAIGREP
jgi:pimeloyl-ACP methyl ester carboxylesterase